MSVTSHIVSHHKGHDRSSTRSGRPFRLYTAEPHQPVLDHRPHRTTRPNDTSALANDRSRTMLLCVVKGRFRRRCWQTSDGPLEVRAGSYQATRCRGRGWSGGPADRSQDSRGGVGHIGGQTRRSDRGASRGEVAVDLAGDVALEDAHDLGLGAAFGECAVRRRRGCAGRSSCG